ncbi:MAG: hypothetical protein ACO1QR_10310 [Chthoniobacteraceae bacterium]
MFETPTEVKSDIPHDVTLAVTFLLLAPAGARFCAWLAALWDRDYEVIAGLFGGVACYALSVGFSLSAVRHPVGRWGRPLGWVMLVLNAVVMMRPVFA